MTAAGTTTSAASSGDAASGGPAARDVVAIARAFATDEVLPRAAELDRPGEFPFDLVRRLGELDLVSLRYPVADGGQGLPFATVCQVYAEVAAGSLTLAAIHAMQSLMGVHFVHRFGTPAQHERFLRPAFRGETVASFCLTEPQAGSDLGAMATRARRVSDEHGDGWVLDGTKSWITNGPVAGFFTVAARTGDEPGLGAIALFLVDAELPGVRVGRIIEKSGVRASYTAEIHFTDVRLPADALLGREGEGVRNVGGLLSEIRVMTAALGVGLGRRALADATRWANQRRAFGKEIGRFQAISHKLADLATDLWAAELMTAEAARLIDAGANPTRQASMAKLFATEACARIVDEATRVYGSYGMSMDHPVQRYFRDCRFLLFGGGTSELLRDLIGKQLLKAAAAEAAAAAAAPPAAGAAGVPEGSGG